MQRNFYRLWLLLMIISGGIAVWFSGSALGGVIKFYNLGGQASAEVSKWQVREMSSSRYAIEASYEFKVDGMIYCGKTKLENPQFLNQFAAENYSANLRSKSIKVWYKKSNPNVSSLEKRFPKKKCLQALLTLGVFAYFYLVRGMAAKMMALAE